MLEFHGKVAVITGAASGIGLALARHCAQEGMKIVVADIAPDHLRETEEGLKTLGAAVLAVPTDVSKVGDMKALLHLTLKQFGAVHLLCNNAGVNSLEDDVRPLWEVSPSEWQRVVDINQWGVIHGIQVFTPFMLQQDTECYMVNTASAAGITVGLRYGIYRMTKHAVVSISETMQQQLSARQAKLRVSVLCPNMINTPIIENAGLHYNTLADPSTTAALTEGEQQTWQQLTQLVRDGMAPSQVAEVVFQALREKAFYIFTHPDIDKARVQVRLENILQQRAPA